MTRKAIDNVGTLTTPKAMMQAIDDNFIELYAAGPSVWGYVSASADTTITAAGTYYPIQGTFVNSFNQFGAATVNTPGIKYTGSETKVFEIDLHAQVSADTLNTDVTIAVYKNGSLVAGSGITGRCRDATSPYPLSSTAVTTLAQNDEIQLMVTSDGNGDVLTFNNLQTTIREFS